MSLSVAGRHVPFQPKRFPNFTRMSRRVGLRTIGSIGGKVPAVYPYIGYLRFDGSIYQPYVTKSSVSDGTWETASDFPYQLSADLFTCVSVIPLTGGKILTLYPSAGAAIRARAWNGATWLSEVVGTSPIFDASDYSSVADGDDVHIVFYRDTSPYDIIYVKYNYSSNSFGDEVIIQPGTGALPYSVPVISRKVSDLYAFWAHNPEENHIYYKRCADGITWDDEPTDWIDETTEGLTWADGRLSCFYKAYNTYISLIYMTGEFFVGPYNIKFAILGRSPSIVGTTSDSHWATYLFYQRKTFYAKGRFWVFYSDGVNMVYHTSTNGVVWSDAVVVRPCNVGDNFSVWFDGTHLHYAACEFDYGLPLCYRRGMPNTDGTITWSAAEQEVVAGFAEGYYQYPFVSTG